ncbi:MAG: hypothetical protein ACKVP2_12015 [Burkholderiales bacterium]
MSRRGCVLALVAVAAGAADAASPPSAERGRRLFVGEATLSARIVGQDFVLPAQANRCINCHGPAAATAGASATAAPPLSATTLAQPRRRRGGPPSRYDTATLCTLLRSGVDPAHVMIDRTMPRYEITDDECRSLWLHLNR